MEFNPNTGELNDKNNSQSPSFEETLEWIKGKIESSYPIVSHIFISSTGKDYGHKAFINKFNFNLEKDTINICFKRKVYFNDVHSPTTLRLIEIKMNLKDITTIQLISFDNFKYEDGSKAYTLQFNSYNSIKNFYHNVTKDGQLEKTENCSMIELDVSDKEIGLRLEKAFNHLLNLVESKKEPF